MKLNLLRRIRNCLDVHSAAKVYKAMILPVFTYCSSVTLGWSETRKSIMRNIEQHGLNIISRKCSGIDLRIPTVEDVTKKKACCLVLDCLHKNVFDTFENMFVINNHGHHTRNNQFSVKLPKVRTEL